MIKASGTFCQKIQRQERCSTYQPSSEAEMLSDEFQVERVERDAEGPVLGRRVQQDEAQGQRNEEARGEAAGELQTEQHGQRCGEAA